MGVLVDRLPEAQPHKPCYQDVMLQQLLGFQLKKRLFGGQFIELGRLLSTSALIFEISGHLGCTFAAMPWPFLIAFDMPAVADMPEQEQAKIFDESFAVYGDKLERFASHAKDGATTEQACVEEFMHSAGLVPETEWSKWLISKEKLPADDAWKVGMVNAATGVQFGLRDVRSFQLMVEHTWKARGSGMALLELFGAQYRDAPRDAEGLASWALHSFEEFCTEYYPEVNALRA